MELVYKKFGVCEDIQYLINKQVHIGYIKLINEDIKTLIGYNPTFNYSCINNIILHINKKCIFRKSIHMRNYCCCYNYNNCCCGAINKKTKFHNLDNKNIIYHTNKVKITLSQHQERTDYYSMYNKYHRIISKVINLDNYNLKVFNSYLEKNRLIHSTIIQIEKNTEKDLNILYKKNGDRRDDNLDLYEFKKTNIETIEKILCKSRDEFYNIVYKEYQNFDNLPNNFVNVIMNMNFNENTFLKIIKSPRYHQKNQEILEFYLNNDLHSRKNKFNFYFERPHRLLHYNCYRKDELIKICNDNKLRGISRLNKNQLVNRLMKMEDNYKCANKNHKKRVNKKINHLKK